MSKAQDYKLSELLDQARTGKLDVIDFQRDYNRLPKWCLSLAQSIAADRFITTGLFWNPDVGEQVSSRFGNKVENPSWILDGQQRITTICALFGVRPHWHSEVEWAKLGPAREAALLLTTDGRSKVVLRSSVEKKTGAVWVSFAQLLETTPVSKLMQDAVLRAGVKLIQLRENKPEVAEQWEIALDATRNTLRNYVFHSFQLASSRGEAYGNFSAINSKGMTRQEVASCATAFALPGYAAKYLDPTLSHLNESGFVGRDTSNHKRFEVLVDQLLPGKYRAVKREQTDAALLESAVKQAVVGTRLAVEVLHGWGLLRQEALSAPSAMTVLTVLLARYPEAQNDPRLLHWFSFMTAAERYVSSKCLNEDLRGLSESTNIDTAFGALLSPYVKVPALADVHLRKDRLGPGATLRLLRAGQLVSNDDLAGEVGTEGASFIELDATRRTLGASLMVGEDTAKKFRSVGSLSAGERSALGFPANGELTIKDFEKRDRAIQQELQNWLTTLSA